MSSAYNNPVANKEVLSIHGHPDDGEQFAGGTLLLLKKAGYGITIAALTDGACGSHTQTAEEITAVRLKEAQDAATLLCAKYVNLGIRDGSIEYNLENTKKLVKLIREINPEIIITHPTDDYMTDHCHTGRLVLWAIPEAGHKNFEVEGNAPPTELLPYTYHTDPQGLTFSNGQIAPVNTVVDISDIIEEKLKAFATHKSQMGLLFQNETQGGEPSAARKTRRWAITRGEQVRIEYGEGFTQELLAEYPRKNILVDLLPGKVYTL